MSIAIVSRNTDLQACYDRFRERIAAVLRLLGKLEKSEDMEETYKALKALKKEHEDADEHLAMEIDKLIREDRITSQMATSLINDGRYVRQVCRKLLSLGRDLVKAADLEESVELEAISTEPEAATEAT